MGTTDRSRRPRNTPAWIAIAALVALVVGVVGYHVFGSVLSGTPRGYEAVPDDELLTAIRETPDVESASLRWAGDWANGHFYEGDVRLRPGLSADEVLAVRDRVALVLRHGRYRAQVVVDVVLPYGRRLPVERGGEFAGATLEDTYGPQTGREDWPPALARRGAEAASGRPAFCVVARDLRVNPLCRATSWGHETYRPDRSDPDPLGD